MKNTVERISPEYFKTQEKYLLYLRHEFAYDYAISQLGSDDLVLEIGFGEGYGTARLAQHVAAVEAVDVDVESVEHARAQHGSEKCRFQTYDGERLPFPDGHFNAVVSLQVIEHVEDDRRFVAEARRVLRPGGLFLLTTPNRTHRILPGKPIWNPFHLREYYPRELEEVLEAEFEEAHVLGIRGDEEAQAIEKARVRRGFHLRKLIPEPVKRLFAGDLSRYSTANFHVTDTNVGDSLDLLGVCRKAAVQRTTSRS